jgi:hypothetical protein
LSNFKQLEQREKMQHSPFVDTALTMFEQAPFYKDLVGIDPNTGQLNRVEVKRIYGALPPPSAEFLSPEDVSDTQLYEFEIYISIHSTDDAIRGKTLVLRVLVQNYAGDFYDRFGIFHPFGVPNPERNSSQPTSSAKPSAIFVHHCSAYCPYRS